MTFMFQYLQQKLIRIINYNTCIEEERKVQLTEFDYPQFNYKQRIKATFFYKFLLDFLFLNVRIYKYNYYKVAQTEHNVQAIDLNGLYGLNWVARPFMFKVTINNLNYGSDQSSV